MLPTHQTAYSQSRDERPSLQRSLQGALSEQRGIAQLVVRDDGIGHPGKAGVFSLGQLCPMFLSGAPKSSCLGLGSLFH